MPWESGGNLMGLVWRYLSITSSQTEGLQRIRETYEVALWNSSHTQRNLHTVHLQRIANRIFFILLTSWTLGSGNIWMQEDHLRHCHNPNTLKHQEMLGRTHSEDQMNRHNTTPNTNSRSIRQHPPPPPNTHCHDLKLVIWICQAWLTYVHVHVWCCTNSLLCFWCFWL